MSCFIIAEAGVNHNGSLDMALALVDAAANAGADAVKFQSFQATKLVTEKADTAEYQKQATGQTSQFEMLKALELSVEAHQKIAARCESVGIAFMSTGFDIETLDFLCTFKMPFLKIPSGEITHHQLLIHVASKNLPLILSTGMSSLEEVAEAIEVISNTRQKRGFKEPLAERLTLLHCTSNYPTQFSDVHLNAMKSLSKTFNLPVGYSDHTEGIFVAPLAVAIGAAVIEKHFTLDRNLPGPDHLASLAPQELKEMVRLIRQTETILGNDIKQLCQNELPVRDLVRRSITLNCNKLKGSYLIEADIALLRPGTGIAPKHFNDVIGKQLKSDLVAGSVLQWENLEV